MLIFLAVAAHRRDHANIFSDLRRHDGHIPRGTGQSHRIGRRRLDGRRGVLVYLYSGGRACVYLRNRGAYQKHGCKQQDNIGGNGEVFPVASRHDGNARRGDIGHLNRKLGVAAHRADFSDLEYDKAVNGAVRRLCGGMDQRFFQSGVRRILPDGARHLRRLQCRTVRDMAHELEMQRDGRSE